MFGGILEFYDFIIFVFFMSIIVKYFFFNMFSFIWFEINIYGIFAVGYLARLFGGIVMVYFGDKFGCKNMFMFFILLMVILIFALVLMLIFNYFVSFGVDSMGFILKNVYYFGYIVFVFLIFVRIC